MKSSIQYFYDTLAFSSDSFDVDASKNELAEIWFWLNADKQIHTRIVYNFQDWLGMIGGFTFGLYTVCKFVLKHYLQYNTSIEVMNGLYGENEDEAKKEGGDKEK